ncbi:MAG TPA: NEW3 domain-containing protein [Pirellulales bacterium]|nr:NEW3 domain-containing protein [Pirellulales bacterium]
MLASLLIVAAAGHMATVARHPDAVMLYQCGFEQNADEDYDHWPDGWTRRRGDGFPHYLPIEISPESPDEGGHSLRFDLDGGAATAYSPAIAIDPRYDYVLHASLKTRQLRYDRAWLSIVFLDQNRQPLETIESEKLGATEGWLPLRIGPVACSRPAARWAKIALHLEPVGQQDLHGAALFDDLWFAQMPRLTLQIAQPHLLYPVGEAVRVRCRVSGYHAAVPDAQIELSDAMGAMLANERLQLQPVASAPEASDPFSDLPKDFLVAEAGWTLPVSEPGYYRLRATVSHDQVDVYHHELRLAVAATVPRPEQGEFGWSLPTGEGTLTLTMLAQWANQSGIHWVKFPLWYDAKDQARVEAINWFADRLNAQGISLVGLLCDPPAETRRVLAIGPAAPVADLFAHPPGLWYPSLEPVMARLSLKVRWWQLGRDDDSSLSGVRSPQVTVARVKKQLDEIGQNSHVGVVWNWLDELPGGKHVPWSFVSRTSEPALAAGEIMDYLAATKTEETKPWLSLSPLDAEKYDTMTRSVDLVTRLVAAKEAGVEKIFFNDPLHAQSGLVRDDGSANELLLPWRTTVFALAGTRFLGRLQLAGGSENRVFARGDQLLAVLWNSHSTLEPVDFGARIQVTDVWGRVRQVESGPGGAPTVEVGPLPVFVSGLNEAVTRWRMSLVVGPERLPSVSGTPHQVRVQWRNYFDQSAGGKLKIVAPDGWRVTPDLIEMKTAAGESVRQNLEVVVPSTASCGRERLRFEFDVQAGGRHRFSVQRPIELGLGDVYLELATHLNAEGELQVDQRTINRTGEKLSFRCYLSAPDRRRMRAQVWKLPPGEDVLTYRLPAGAELLGQKLRVQAEEIGGKRRTLNYNFVAEP